MLRIAILDLATPFPGMERYDTAGQLIHAWLEPALPEAVLDVVEVARGTDLPALGDYDGYVLSGSEQGVYDTPPWITPLRSFLTGARQAGRPLVGICFGHQIMAETFGGRTENVERGMVIGARRFAVDGAELDTHVWHQDQVVAVPPGARVAGSAPYCPVGVLEYDFPAYSVQFHPEYTAPYMSNEIRVVTGSILTEEVAKEALRSIATASVPRDLVAERAAQVLRGG